MSRVKESIRELIKEIFTYILVYIICMYSIYNYDAKSLSFLAHVAIKLCCQSVVKKVFMLCPACFLSLPRALFLFSFFFCSFFVVTLILKLPVACRLWSVDNFPLHLCNVWQLVLAVQQPQKQQLEESFNFCASARLGCTL